MQRGPIMLTGAGGMLGSAFRAHLREHSLECLGRDLLDVATAPVLLERLRALRPALVINCAADTNVEAAEAAPGPAFAANALLPEILAQGCREVGATLVHFSSTGCYGGTATAPHGDYDPLFPTSVHHRAKAAGEAAVREAGARSLILRLGWLYGGSVGQRRNFVWTRIVEARNTSEINSDPYQTGTPTYVGDVVTQTMALLEGGLCGTFNCVAGGSATRFDYVQRIVTLAGLDTRLVPRRFARRAPVAANEAATNDKLDLLGLNLMPGWEEGLAHYVGALLAAEASA